MNSPELPPALREVAEQSLALIIENCALAQQTALNNYLSLQPQVKTSLLKILALSDYVKKIALADTQWFIEFVIREHWASRVTLSDYIASLSTGGPARDNAELRRALIQIRNRCLVLIVWRDLTRIADMRETTACMSLMADQLIEYALTRLYHNACERHGTPVGDTSGKAQKLCVIALGKLGGYELNLSSDVDLVFAYPEAGVTDKTGKSNQGFFLELAQDLIKTLDRTTVDGFVFRVDMRLRPYGESGALVCNFSAMEIYFAQQGREWERYAWVKARACAGDLTAGEMLIAMLKPFVYRRYLDFGSIDSLRIMKQRMDGPGSRKAPSKEKASNVKLGPGGIRDIEFIVQLRQLIWGGRYPELKLSGFEASLEALIRRGLIEKKLAARLHEAYIFFRDSEHALQAMRDEQTQLLPEKKLDQLRLAVALGFTDFAAYAEAYHVYRTYAIEELEEHSNTAGAEVNPWETQWQNPDQDQDKYADTQALLSAFEDPLRTINLFQQLRTSRDQPRVGARGRSRLDELMPVLLSELVKGANPLRTLERCVKILEAVLRRSSYLVLLLENPLVLKRLLDLTSKSGYIAGELAKNPWLIDEIIDPRILDDRLDLKAMRGLLDTELLKVDADLENFIEVIRNFKESITFAVAAGELNGDISVMHVSDYLTYAAEAILHRACDFALRETAEKYTTENALRSSFAIIGYGKLGGNELGPASDLDLVFLHDMSSSSGQFLYRLARRLVHILTIRTRSGGLYEIDTRLRPSGNAGTMVSPIAAFERYQKETAQIWEHQALVRARAVAGDPALCDKFEKLRIELLTQKRDRSELREQVVNMRQRMHKNMPKSEDVKRASGGMVDIEFIVQYLVLAWASEYPEICTYTDNVRILRALGNCGVLNEQDVGRLTEAYLELRAENHRSSLDIPDQRRALQTIQRYHGWVTDCWERVLLSN
ncbi:MAG: bifunctional [glutamate--ammonia ligase]-adenylyl-L-tyrosine phosphorylase/[glutamate--ammonia-ligase] adenylyltransferase [Pseudomonadales bacterium]|nr:bifunctional [glutamate--ammonia ligase]-adenylyl-L-tyrosine phosphorylase/[glutamate--ammonia-ligase] adenylyltransferase [Pseudomonadales bacterium]